jgi:hypothetical protein
MVTLVNSTSTPGYLDWLQQTHITQSHGNADLGCAFLSTSFRI